jgi:hypothetical protein
VTYYYALALIITLAPKLQDEAQNGAQAQAPQATAFPQTKLEGFESRRGTVVLRGFAPVGRVLDKDRGDVELECVEMWDSKSSRREYGVKVRVTSDQRLRSSGSAFVDYEEIDPLLQGIDYILKIESTITKMDTFQADYRTPSGNLGVSVANTKEGERVGMITAGTSRENILLNLEALQKVRDLFVKAKTRLDQARQ